MKVVDTVSGDTNTFTARWHIFFHTNGVVSRGVLATAITVKVVDTVSAVTNAFSFSNSISFPHEWGGVELGR